MIGVHPFKAPYSTLILIEGDAGDVVNLEWFSSSTYYLMVATGSVQVHGESLSAIGFEKVDADEELSLQFEEDETRVVLMFTTPQFLSDVVRDPGHPVNASDVEYVGKMRETLPKPISPPYTMSASDLDALLSLACLDGQDWEDQSGISSRG